jgi:hypothetical protein
MPALPFQRRSCARVTRAVSSATWAARPRRSTGSSSTPPTPLPTRPKVSALSMPLRPHAPPPHPVFSRPIRALALLSDPSLLCFCAKREGKAEDHCRRFPVHGGLGGRLNSVCCVLGAARAVRLWRWAGVVRSSSTDGTRARGLYCCAAPAGLDGSPAPTTPAPKRPRQQNSVRRRGAQAAAASGPADEGSGRRSNRRQWPLPLFSTSPPPHTPTGEEPNIWPTYRVSRPRAGLPP